MRRWILVFFLLSGLVGGLISELQRRDFFKIKKFQLSLETVGSGQDLLLKPIEALKLDLERYVGQSLLDIPLAEISSHLKEQAWVESAQLQRLWPNEIRMRLAPQEFIFILRGTKGESFAVLKSGALLGKSELGEGVLDEELAKAEWPLLVGEAFEKDRELRQRGVRFFKELPDQGSFRGEMVNEISYDKKLGFVLKLKDSSTKIVLGEGDILEKSKRLSKVMDYSSEHQLELEVLDARIEGRIYAKRLANESREIAQSVR